MNMPTRFLRMVVISYQRILSPVLPESCRYVPTCSEYTLDALEIHGALKGTWMATCRILSCHPWGGSGWDPVPNKKQKQ